MLAPLDLRISESAAPEELLRHQDEDPAGVLIVAGRMAAPAASDMLREFVARAREAGFGTCKILAVHSDNSQDRLLAASGFTHAIPEPLDTAELRSTVLDLVEYVSADYAPVAKAGSPQARPDNMEDIQKTVVDQDWEEDERQPVSSEEPRESLPDWLETARPSVDEVPDRPILPGRKPTKRRQPNSQSLQKRSLKRSLPRKPDKKKDQRRTWRLAPLMP